MVRMRGATLENIRIYIKYSHCKFRIYGLNVSLWYVEGARDKADLFHLPALALYRITYDSPEGYVLVLSCQFGPRKVPIADIGHTLMLQNAKDPDLISYGWEDRHSVRSHPAESSFWSCQSGQFSMDQSPALVVSIYVGRC
jgi:hypothetical protein